MKHIKSILIISLIACTLSGCTYWTQNEPEKNRVESSNESISNKEYVYTDDLSTYSHIKLHLDIDVSDVTIKTASDSTLTLTQHANEKKIFVIATRNVDGDTLDLTFDSPDNNITFNTLNSDIVIELPEGLLYTLDASIDVGKFDLITSDLEFKSLDISTDVGDVDVSFGADQPQLTSLLLSSDVGKVNTFLKGDHDKLTTIELESDIGDLFLETTGNFETLKNIEIMGSTGKVDLSLDGVYKTPLTIDTETDIGTLSLEFNGQYSDETIVNCNTSTGGIDLKLDPTLKAKLFADEDEFTSEIKFGNIKYAKQDDFFFINDATSDQFDMTIEADTDLGDIAISH